VWVERSGRLVRTGDRLGSPADVRALAVRLAAAGGRRLDDAAPAVDARLPDGTRLHAVLPPLAGPCAVLSLRAVRARPFTLDELVAGGTVPPPVAPVLRALVDARANVLVTGSTGSGKTTLLATLLSLVPADQRIVVVEEAGELRPDHPHVLHLACRQANADGAGEVGLPRLVREALRMRPDRLVLGECRGAEVREVLTALNTGHEGGFATLHANAAADVPARLEALGALAGLGRDALGALAVAAFDAVLHLRRAPGGALVGRAGASDARAGASDDRPGAGGVSRADDGGSGAWRYLAEVAIVRRARDGTLEVAPALLCDPDGAVRPGPAWTQLTGRLAPALGRPRELSMDGAA
jgi:pilus assembly protein CpaF